MKDTCDEGRFHIRSPSAKIITAVKNIVFSSTLASLLLAAFIPISLLVLGCLVQTESVQGETGPQGPPGEDGVPDTGALSTLQTKVNELEAKLEALQNTVSKADCPSGYSLSPDPTLPSVVRCTLGDPGQEYDELVRVGSGSSSFWVDRFEASAWTDSSATMGADPGVPFGAAGPDYPASFVSNGQVAKSTDVLYARSRKDVLPSQYITWFQAQLACAMAGKRLPTNYEWQLAATGTPDPMGPNQGANGTCLTDGPSPRPTGATGAETHCSSIWGVQDMIGNLGEWIADWYPAPGDTMVSYGISGDWPDGYGGDKNFNVTSFTMFSNNPPDIRQGLPAGALRGGYFASGSSGVFTMNLNHPPSVVIVGVGFRCIVKP